MTADAQASLVAPQAAAPTRGLRNLLFFAAFFLVWLSVRPFRDLSDPGLLDPSMSGDTLNQVSALLLSASLAVFVALNNRTIVFKAVTPLLVLTLAWFALSTLYSDYPELAARRLLLTVLIIFNAVAFLTLPTNREHFGRLLATAAFTLLVICFASVIIVPDLAIHQTNDVLGADLVGAWRGPFEQKNDAGAGMVILIFISIFVARTVNVAVGTLAIALAGIFLFYTHAKSPIILLPVILLMSVILDRITNRSTKFCAVIALPLIINFLAIGSVCSEGIHNLLASILPDVTFTGRDQIWRFTLDHIMQRPILGYGFQAFWETSGLISGAPPSDWVSRANSAHNGILNLAVMTGVVGALLSLLWFLVQTATDYTRLPPNDRDPMTSMFVQIWLFTACWDSMESSLFAGGDHVWFMTLVSIFGLRFQRLTLEKRWREW
ncbi:MAG: O-antigen ligase [Xanthobacteraceae bacterium]